MAILALTVVLLAACGRGGASSDEPEGEAAATARDSEDGPEAQGEPIRVAEVATVTGPVSIYGQPMSNAYQLAVAAINEDGGVDVGGVRRPLELVQR